MMNERNDVIASKEIEIMRVNDVERILSFLKDKNGRPRGLNHAYLWEIASSEMMRVFYTESENINNIFYGLYIKAGIVIEDWYSDGFSHLDSVLNLIDLYSQGKILFAFDKEEIGNKFGWTFNDEVLEMICYIDKREYVDSCPFYNLHYRDEAIALLSQELWTEVQATNFMDITFSNPYGFSKIALADAGHVIAFCHTMYDKGYAWINCVYVDKDSRRKGYGHRLVESVLAELNEKEIIKVFLRVFKSNTNAIKLYGELGFQFTDFRKWQFEVSDTLPRD